MPVVSNYPRYKNQVQDMSSGAAGYEGREDYYSVADPLRNFSVEQFRLGKQSRMVYTGGVAFLTGPVVRSVTWRDYGSGLVTEIHRNTPHISSSVLRIGYHSSSENPWDFEARFHDTQVEVVVDPDSASTGIVGPSGAATGDHGIYPGVITAFGTTLYPNRPGSTYEIPCHIKVMRGPASTALPLLYKGQRLVGKIVGAYLTISITGRASQPLVLIDSILPLLGQAILPTGNAAGAPGAVTVTVLNSDGSSTGQTVEAVAWGRYSAGSNVAGAAVKGIAFFVPYSTYGYVFIPSMFSPASGAWNYLGTSIDRTVTTADTTGALANALGTLLRDLTM